MKYLLFPILLFCVSVTLNAQPKIGSTAPEIVLKDPDGKSISLSSLKGKVVLVDFWASWCMPCRKSNHALLPVYTAFHERGFEILGISLDQDAKDWQRAVVQDKINWLQVNEPGGWDATVSTAWKIEFLPTSFLLDKQGRIISIDPGTSELKKYLQQALKKE